MPKRTPLLTINKNGRNGVSTPILFDVSPIAPSQPSSSEGITSFGGQVYIAPWSKLAESIDATTTVILVTSSMHVVGDTGVLSHYLYGNEQVTIIGGPIQKGELYEYTIARGAAPLVFPANETLFFDLGSADDGGYISIVSGNQTQGFTGPHINMWAFENGIQVRKLKIGRLSTLTTQEKALFPDVTDWNVFGTYGDAMFLKGHFDVGSGHVSGNLVVDKTITVAGGIDNAGVVIGDTPAGFGWSLNNMQGRPVIAAVSPYHNDSTTEVAFFIEHEGTRGLYYHKSPTTGKYVLDIGADTIIDGRLRASRILAGLGTFPGSFTGVRLGDQGIYTYGTDFLPQVEIPSESGFLYFGNREGWLSRDGITIDSRLLPVGADEFEHTLKWYNSSNYSSDFIGAAVGSYATGGWFAIARRRILDIDANDLSAQGIDDFYESRITLLPGGVSKVYGQTVQLSADDRVLVQVGGGQSSIFDRTRVNLPALSVAGSLLHTTDNGLTVAFGTNTPPVGSRVVIQDDTQTALMIRRSNDQFFSVFLQASISSGQQSPPTSGYVMRANTATDISTYANKSADYIMVQNWLYEHGLQTYTPQAAKLLSTDISLQYDELIPGLNWSAAAITETLKFPHPLVFDYNDYYYRTDPNDLAWTLGGIPVTQDAMSLGTMTTVLGNTLIWFNQNGITDPWIMIDEPPHGTSGNWSSALEARVIKFTTAAVAAGFKVGVSTPSLDGLAYWRTRLSPTRWILAAKFNRAEYPATLPAGEIWLYNRTNKDAGKPMSGLAQQMRDFGATGYLHWSANSDVGTWPLLTVSGTIITATEYGSQLLEELRLFAETDVPPVQPVNEQWLTASGTMILNARSGYVTKPPSFAVSLGSVDRPWSHVYAQHLHGTLGSQTALASGSSMYISAYTMSLAVGLEIGNVLAYAEQENIPTGKFFRATNPDDDSFEVIKVQSTGRTAGDWWEYDVERGLDGTEQYWPEGTTWADLGGNALDGWIRLWGADDLNPNTGPSIAIFQRDNDDLPDSASERAVFGNMNGFYDFDENHYGVAFGRYLGSWTSLDSEHGLRIMYGQTQLARYQEAIDLGVEDGAHIHIDPDDITMFAGQVPVIELLGTGDANITGTLAVATGGAITWAGGKGMADDTGIYYIEDSDNYWKTEPSSSYVSEIKTTGIARNGLMVYSEKAFAVRAQSVSSAGVYSVGGTYGIHGIGGGGSGVLGETSTASKYGVIGQASGTGGVGVRAAALVSATTALQIVGGIVDGGSQRYTAMGTATAGTDGMNRDTSDARYAPIAGAHAAITLSAEAGAVLGLTGQEITLDTQTANYGFLGPTTGAAAAPTFRALVAADIAPALLSGIVAPTWRPASDGTAAIKIQNAAGTSDLLTADTTNLSLGLNTAPLSSVALTADKSVITTNATGLSLTTSRSNHNAGVSSRTIIGVDITTRTTSTSVSAKTTNQFGFQVTHQVNADTTYTTTIGTLAGAVVNSPTVSGGGTNTITASRGMWIKNQGVAAIANSYAFYIDTQTGAATASYALYSNGGQSFMKAGGDAITPLVLQQGASPSANVLELQSSSAAVLGGFTPNGGLLINEQGLDVDSRMEGDTATNLFVLDAGLDAIQIGTTTAGVIADFRSAAIVFNEDGSDRDTRIEGDTDANLFFLDASTDRIGIGTNAPGYKLDVAGGVNVTSGNVYTVNGVQILGAQGAAVADATDAASTMARLNDLLARVRAHGLIAT